MRALLVSPFGMSAFLTTWKVILGTGNAYSRYGTAGEEIDRVITTEAEN